MARESVMRRMVRRPLFWCHLVTGVTVGVVVLMMSVTGVLLAYEREITDWANRVTITPPPGAVARVSLDTIVGKVTATGTLASVGVKSAATAPVTVQTQDRRTMLVNPYTGIVVGTGSPHVEGFFRTVESWHKSLGMGFESPNRKVAAAITSACNLAFLFLVLSGFVLWWPRQITWQTVKSVTFLKRKAQGKARDWNWHHVAGIWAAPFLFCIVLSAVFMSYAWPTQVLGRMFGEPVSTPTRDRGDAGASQQRDQHDQPGAHQGEHQRDHQGAPQGEPEGKHRHRDGHRDGSDDNHSTKDMTVGGPSLDVPQQMSLDAVVAEAQTRVPDWKSITVRLPSPASNVATADAGNGPNAGQPGRGPRGGGRSITVMIDAGNGVRPDLRSQMTVNPRSGRVMQWQTYDSYTPSRKVRAWVRSVHTGQVGGILGETIAVLASLAATVLVCTGLLLAIRRLRAWWGRRVRGEERPADVLDDMEEYGGDIA